MQIDDLNIWVKFVWHLRAAGNEIHKVLDLRHLCISYKNYQDARISDIRQYLFLAS